MSHKTKQNKRTPKRINNNDYDLVINPLYTTCIKLPSGKTFLLACRCAKEAVRDAMEQKKFSQEETESIIAQVKEKIKIHTIESRQRKQQFEQYIAEIKK